MWLYYIPISLPAAAQSKTEQRWQVNGVAWIRLRLRPPPLRGSLWQVAVDVKSLWYFHDWLTAWNCTHHLDSIVMHLACRLSLKCRKLDSNSRLAFQPYTVWQENRPLFFCSGGAGTEWEAMGEGVRKHYRYYVLKTGQLRCFKVLPIPPDYMRYTTHPPPRPSVSYPSALSSFARAQPGADTKIWRRLAGSRAGAACLDRGSAEKLRCSRDHSGEGSFSSCLLD